RNEQHYHASAIKLSPSHHFWSQSSPGFCRGRLQWAPSARFRFEVAKGFKRGSNRFNTLLSQDKYKIRFEKQVKKFAIYDPEVFEGGTVDSYPFDQTEVIASGLNYKPRPIPQSYSVYTPELLRMNADSLLEPDAPEYLLWRVRSIDNRLPMLMEGVSWPIILKNYAPEAHGKLRHEILLRKKDNSQNIRPRMDLIDSNTIRFRQEVHVPTKSPLLWATVDVEYTLLGKLIKLFWRPPSVFMAIQLSSTVDGKTYKKGSRIVKRFIPAMGKTPFLISPFVREKDFPQIYNLLHSDSPAVKRDAITSFSIIPDFAFSNHRFENKILNSLALACFKKEIKLSYFIMDASSANNAKGKQVWTLSRKEDLARTHHLNDLRVSAQGIEFQTTGPDPQLVIKSLPIMQGKTYSICVNKKGKKTSYQLFYKTHKSPRYDGVKQYTFFSRDGENVCTQLPHTLLPESVRLDPGNTSGQHISQEIFLIEHQ
ncbi:MAG: hypothetical protein PHC98_00180, partial [Syntrophotalea acetylenica]|nr:hypothetical protein [Syntrophotalea acetylenica]